MDIKYVEMFRYEPTEWKDLGDYWLASRCFNYSEGYGAGKYDWVEYGLFYITSGTINANCLHNSSNDIYEIIRYL